MISFSPIGVMMEMIVTDTTTKELVARAQAGDREAFARLVERHEARLRETIEFRMGRRVRAKTEIDDLLQEAYLRAFESIAHFEWRDESGFLRWLVSIAENRMRDMLKGPRGKEVLEVQEHSAVESATVSRRARRDERFERLKDSLAHLSPDYRKVILLARIEGLKIREVAERMGRSESAIKNLLLRALREMKSSFGETASLRLPDRSLEDYEGP